MRVDDVREGLSGFSPFALPSIHSLSIAGVIHTHTHTHILSRPTLCSSLHLFPPKEIPVLGMLASIPSDIELSSPFFSFIFFFFFFLSFHSFLLSLSSPYSHSLFPPFCYNRLVAGLALPWLPGRPSSRGQASIDSVYSPTSITTWTAFL